MSGCRGISHLVTIAYLIERCFSYPVIRARRDVSKYDAALNPDTRQREFLLMQFSMPSKYF